MAEAVTHPSSVPLLGSAYYCTEFGKNFATTDLKAIVGRPNHAPQIVLFTNYGTTEQNAVYTPKGGSSQTHPLQPGGSWLCTIPVVTLTDTSGADVAATAYWWPTPDHVNVVA